MDQAKEIANLLLDLKAVGVRTNPPYTWSSGQKRPMYCDNRLVISYPKERKIIVDALIALIKEKNLEFDVIGGTASAAVPWASFIAYALDKPMVYIKKASKGYGTDKLIEGTMPQGARILIVEDLISTGGSSLRAAEACQKEFGAKVAAVVAIFTYEMKEALEAFTMSNIPLYAISNFHALIDVAEEKNYIRPEELKEIQQWSEDPTDWDKKYNNSVKFSEN